MAESDKNNGRALLDVNERHVREMRERMASAESGAGSTTFCSAKWLQSTIMLYNGFTHSCHHPPAHRVPLDEVAADPGALHNTRHKHERRAEMLAGKRPSECSYCWTIEDLPGSHISDRTYKTANQQWSWPALQRALEAGAEGKVMPSYVEVAFDTTCNLRCGYCSADVSSKWWDEIERFGQYPTETSTNDLEWLRQTNRAPIPQRADNPYVEAFWKWWPTLYPNLRIFRITGGEPLLSKHTWRVLDLIAANPRPDLRLALNTNMSVPDEMIDRLIAANRAMRPQLEAFDVFTSVEAEGADAEYIRFGMSYPKFLDNCRRFLRETDVSVKLNFMVTFNALSVPSFDRFLDMIWRLRDEFNEQSRFSRVSIMVNYLRWPPYLSARILPQAMRVECANRLRAFVAARTRITSDSPRACFYVEEVDQIDRLGKFLEEPDTTDPEQIRALARDRRDFGRFTAEHDRRRGTDFDKVFPSLSAFRADCLDNAAAWDGLRGR